MAEENKDTFYNQGEQDQREAGRINPLEAAHELGHVQAEQGMSAMDRREGELERQHEDGKTDEERNNIKLMDLLREKYPHSFIEMTDKKGRRLLVLRPGNQLGQTLQKVTSDYLAYTEYGPVGFMSSGRKHNLGFMLEKRQIDLTALVDLVQLGKTPKWAAVTVEADIPGEQAPFKLPLVAFTPDLLIERDREELRNLHMTAEDNEMKKLAASERLQKTIQAEEMVQSL